MNAGPIPSFECWHRTGKILYSPYTCSPSQCIQAGKTATKAAAAVEAAAPCSSLADTDNAMIDYVRMSTLEQIFSFLLLLISVRVDGVLGELNPLC